MILITTYYQSDNLERQKEIDECLKKNVENELISSIHLLNDNIYEFPKSLSNKIRQIIVDEDSKKRLNYSYAIKYINDNCPGEICLLANSDMYYDNSLSLLKNISEEKWKNTFYALSRYNIENIENIGNDNKIKLQYGCQGSQDTWIFKSPAKIDYNDCDFHFGLPACDHKIAFSFYKNGYNVLNPCFDIISYHLHKSNYRTYNNNQSLPGKGLFIIPSFLQEENVMIRETFKYHEESELRKRISREREGKDKKDYKM